MYASYAKRGSDKIMMWHAGEGWLVGKAEDLGKTRGYVLARGAALKPEEIGSGWEVWSTLKEGWDVAPGLRCVAQSEAEAESLSSTAAPPGSALVSLGAAGASSPSAACLSPATLDALLAEERRAMAEALGRLNGAFAGGDDAYEFTSPHETPPMFPTGSFARPDDEQRLVTAAEARLCWLGAHLRAACEMYFDSAAYLERMGTLQLVKARTPEGWLEVALSSGVSLARAVHAVGDRTRGDPGGFCLLHALPRGAPLPRRVCAARLLRLHPAARPVARGRRRHRDEPERRSRAGAHADSVPAP